MQTILGIKQGQGQRFLENGTRIPVSVVRVPQNTVLAVKTTDKDGYNAVQIGMGEKKKANKALLGHAKKANLTNAPKIIKEVKTTDALPQGEFVLIASVLAPGDIINVSGTSKGKGFAGGVKRHNFKGGPRTHGQSDRERAPGSLGQTTTPGRVYKGKRMAGHMGSVTKTVSNLLVVAVNEKNQEILIKGLVPGNVGNILTITKVGALSEKKIVALLPDPLNPTPVEEVIEQAAVEESPVVEEVALNEEKQADTADDAAQTAEEKVASANEIVEAPAPEDSQEEKKEEVTEDGK